MTVTVPSESKSPIGIELPRSNYSILGRDGPPAFVLWGDSHAMAIVGLCDELARSKGLSGQCFAAPGIHPLLGVWDNHHQKREVQLEWNRRVVEWIKRNKVSNVIMVARWEMAIPSRQIDWRDRDIEVTDEDAREMLENCRMMFVIQDDHSRGVSHEDARRVLQEHFDETISSLEPAGTRVWFLMQVPVQNERPCARLTRGVPAKAYEAQQYEINRVLKSCTRPMLTVLGPGKCWFDRDGFSCMGDSGGSYYIDKNHVSSHGAEKLLRPLLEPIFDRMKKDLRHLKQL